VVFGRRLAVDARSPSWCSAFAWRWAPCTSFEFAAAKITGSAADAFLGGQGDVWDIQWDMTWCLIGATCALLFFTGIQDRALEKLKLRIDKLPY